jgi:NADH-quinone oxidoreductase subunit L
MVWLVFFGEARVERHVHDAGPAMRVSLIALAVGTLTTWLLAGPFATMLHNTLPAHEIHALTTGEMITEVVGAPITLVALAVIVVGILLWFGRRAFKGLAGLLDAPAKWASQDFGFSWLSRSAVKLTQDAASGLRLTQTGVLSWNVAGITIGLIGLMIVLVILAGGAL